MRRREDDLTAWGDDPVVRALTAPGTPEELAGGEAVLAAFRATAPSRSRRRLAGRFGTGATTVVTVIALSATAAAAAGAYSSSLPTGLQRVAHGLLGPVGVPAPHRHHVVVAGRGHHHGAVVAGPADLTGPGVPGATGLPTPGRQPASRPGSTGSPSVSGTAAATPSGPAHGGASPSPTTSGGSGRRQPAAAPTTGTTPPAPGTSGAPGSPGSGTPGSGTTSPPAPAPAPVAASLTATTSTRRIPADDIVLLSGRLTTSDGAAVPDHRVWATERLAGSSQAQRVASAVSDSSGDVTVDVPPLQRNARVRLVAGHGVRSAALAIVVLPGLSVSTRSSQGSCQVGVTTVGGNAGDSIVLRRREKGRLVVVGTGRLDADGAVTFTVPVPRRSGTTVHYRLALARTSDHAAAAAAFTVSGSG